MSDSWLGGLVLYSWGIYTSPILVGVSLGLSLQIPPSRWVGALHVSRPLSTYILWIPPSSLSDLISLRVPLQLLWNGVQYVPPQNCSLSIINYLLRSPQFCTFCTPTVTHHPLTPMPHLIVLVEACHHHLLHTINCLQWQAWLLIPLQALPRPLC